MECRDVKIVQEIREYERVNQYLKAGWIMLGYYVTGDYFPDCRNVLQEPRYILAWTTESAPLFPNLHPKENDLF